MTAARDPWLRRLERDTLVAGVVLAVGAAVLWPEQPRRALGVLGGLGLVAVSYRGILAGVSGLWTTPVVEPSAALGPAPHTVPPAPSHEEGVAAAQDETRYFAPSRPSRGFVKFFTRHAILALGAYVMMARLDFDPMAMLAGVTAPAVAAAVEIVRTVRARRSGLHSRSS